MPAPTSSPDRHPAAPGRTQRADARRNLEAIVAAAIPLLSEQPRASMQQIAAAAGVHRATVHRHFPNRDDLLDELRTRALSTALDELDAVLAQPSPEPGDTLERAIVALMANGDRYRLYRFTTWRSAESDDREIAIGARLIALIEPAQGAGQVRPDLAARQLAIALGGLMVAFLPQIADGSLPLDDAAAAVRALVR